ncbi:family 20 glycosylhydrolase [Fulvivirgaceae bacterium BMA10]|uniref:beta-N-acetylhexosaminidase n=1 Tax=Splendidivirga corallicola TaxID=3051826 RepID=A0ABT8KQA4_9BACT|nr:family 20 glycosylhydrolase [Fulvivirgaceae bacterium BMA10]
MLRIKMKQLFSIMSFFVFVVLFSTCSAPKHEVKEYNKGLHIVPLPLQLTEKEGVFGLNANTKIIIQENDEIKPVVTQFNQRMTSALGQALAITSDTPSKNYIQFSLDDTCDQGGEGYCLSVTPDGVTIKSKSPRGLFYGMQTLLQLLPAEVESKSKITSVDWDIPCVEISDEPRFKWRGMHLDVCRHFLPVDFIKKQLDVMAMYKLNTFHWHLTEDQGWRIEIKKYPKLTEIGSIRIDEGKEYGGYYTQEEIKEVVAYAAERFIDVVPEIELPGHSLAALTGYPHLSCEGGPFKVRNVWGVEPDIYCAGNEETFEFLEDVIDEVTQLFPYEYFHIGGDEAPKKRWETCKRCQGRIKSEGLADEHELQSYFIKRAEAMLLKRNKKLIGWDEILEGGLAPSAAVMSWRGEKGGIEAAEQGHDVVMTPGNWVYLDHYQGSSKVEPVAIGGYTTLEESYGYEPVPKELEAEKAKHILGTQGNVWTEYMYTPEIAEYRIYPRIIALAEVGWTAKDKKNFDGFLTRMDNQFVRLDHHGVNYHIPLPEGPSNNVAFLDSISLTFTTTRPIDMVYTIDGSEPDESSAAYIGPLSFSDNTTLKIRSVLSSGKMSKVRTINVKKETLLAAQAVENVASGINLKLKEGEYYSVASLGSTDDWESRTLTDPKEGAKLFDYKEPSAAVLSGYVEIPDDGVYEFSTDLDQFFIGDRKLIDNDGEVKRFSRNDASIALQKGLHPIKAVFLNNVYGGWPHIWSGLRISYRKQGAEKFESIPLENFKH